MLAPALCTEGVEMNASTSAQVTTKDVEMGGKILF